MQAVNNALASTHAYTHTTLCAAMRPFMDYIQKAFYESSLWDVDNSYSSLTATSQG